MDRFIPLAVLLPQLGLTDLEWSQKRITRLVRDGTIQPTEYSVSRHRIFKRGKPRKEYALSRLGAYLFAMAVRTTQADEWRRLQAERLNALMETNASNALPAAPVDGDEIAALRSAFYELEMRFAQVAGKTGALSARVDSIETKLEARPSRQLALPGLLRDSLQVRLEQWLATQPAEQAVTLADVAGGLSIPPSAFDAGLSKRLGLLLRSCGWGPVCRARRDGSQIRIYRMLPVVATH